MKINSNAGQFKAVEKKRFADKVCDVVVFIATPVLMYYMVAGAYWLSKHPFFQSLVTK